MIDLREEISMLELTSDIEVDKVFKILDQYNIITAPKSIKLSEIVNKLNEFYCIKKEIRVYVDKDKEGYIEKVIDVNLGNIQISSIHIRIFDKKIMYLTSTPFAGDWFKWLYTLWIAGTTIIDDLEG